MTSWLDGELEECQFADARLGKRFRTLLERLSKRMGETIPMACQPFDQEKWAAVYSAYDAAAAVAAFSAARHWNLLFLKALPPEAFSTPVTHPERGT